MHNSSSTTSYLFGDIPECHVTCGDVARPLKDGICTAGMCICQLILLLGAAHCTYSWAACAYIQDLLASRSHSAVDTAAAEADDAGTELGIVLVLHLWYLHNVLLWHHIRVLSSIASDSTVRTCLYGPGYPRQPSLQVTLAKLTFHLFLCKIQPTFT